ncbi:choline BCCT transporter BetT [Promicromonospora thailandica]|uniref:Choline/glycine/proline betaine transport protein n=1 Tax=Promicromonospora thailandica TaxID=765201 RepID=A0A9X2JYC7_9MICO|nr:choline BCCT transporter BetT [Promicromonospora thailandica]MCP2264964.1 choline/glycine/proline betaine transport protein [Promicromonospora thailandica]BFF18757.1 choline BCCT transporter BetT [Promicromonospora thailandica]
MSIPATTESPTTSEDNDAPPKHHAGINPPVFYGSAALILAVALAAIVRPAATERYIGVVVAWIADWFGAYYVVVAAAFLVFVIGVALSRTGRIKLGPEQAKPQFGLLTWSAMLFAAGIGTDLMFFSVAEPATQYLAPPVGEGGTVEAARMAIVWTLFHYGLIGWGMYALMGMAIAYFAYRRNMPLSIRSALHPLFGDRVWGRLGDVVDVAAVIGTIFGLATTLGIGVEMLNRGLAELLGAPIGVGVQAALLGLAVVMATLSVVSGVARGVRRLSELNVVLALLLVLFLVVTGSTTFLFDALVMNLGDYLSRLPGMTLDTFAFEAPTDWLNAWTLFFWAWWVAWAPFVGLFLARISRGRTIRQFVVGVLTVPFVFILLWVSVFGNSALQFIRDGGAEGAAFGDAAMNDPASGIFALLERFPAAPLTIGLAIFVGLLFYVTSADSGALVLSTLTSKLHRAGDDGPVWLRVFWAAATGLLTLGMLIAGGIATLQSGTIIMGLPFSLVMFGVMFALHKALRSEGRKLDTLRVALPNSLSGRIQQGGPPGAGWRQRVARLVSFPGRRQTLRFLDQTVRPALAEVSAELAEQGITTACSETLAGDSGLPALTLTVEHGDEAPFTYTLWPQAHPTPTFRMNTSDQDDTYFRVEVLLAEGTQGYDVTGYAKEQLIADVLDQYERHLLFLHASTTPAHETEQIEA